MKVAQLIKALQKMPQDLDVLGYGGYQTLIHPKTVEVWKAVTILTERGYMEDVGTAVVLAEKGSSKSRYRG